MRSEKQEMKNAECRTRRALHHSAFFISCSVFLIRLFRSLAAKL
jgi:hypothetical protein